MKKTVKVIFVVIATLVLCVIMAACNAQTKFVGTYKFQAMSMQQGATTITIKVNEPVLGLMTYSEDAIVLTVTDDGNFELKMDIYGINDSQKGTWRVEEGNLVLTIDDEDVIATLAGGVLSFTETEAGATMKMELKKQ